MLVRFPFRPTFECGGHLVTDSGIVASEGFPTPYKPSSKCTWYITVSNSSLQSSHTPFWALPAPSLLLLGTQRQRQRLHSFHYK